jgi:hypothetical protein
MVAHGENQFEAVVAASRGESAQARKRRRAPLPATATKQTYFLSFTAPYANATIIGVNTISLIATG